MEISAMRNMSTVESMSCMSTGKNAGVESTFQTMFQKLTGGYKQSCPYEYLAKDGVIEYNGIVFACDTMNNAISLGDVSDKSKVITVRLEGGGMLYVNRENIGDLSQAMGMFSPEDVNRILRALADDAKAQKTQQEIEDAQMNIKGNEEE